MSAHRRTESQPSPEAVRPVSERHVHRQVEELGSRVESPRRRARESHRAAEPSRAVWRSLRRRAAEVRRRGEAEQHKPAVGERRRRRAGGPAADAAGDRAGGPAADAAGDRAGGPADAAGDRAGGPAADAAGDPQVATVEHEITTRARLRKVRTRSRRGRRLWAAAALAVVVTGLGVTLAPEAGYKSFGDRFLTVQDPTTPETPTFDTDQTNSPQIPDATPTPSTTASPSVTASSRKPRRTPTSEGDRSSSAAQPGGSRRGVILDGRTMGGWYAGASGTGVTDGGFTNWLGQPVTVAATWADTSDEVQRTVSGLSGYADWNGAIDIAVGGTVLDSGENYAAAASGAYDDRWRAAAQVIAKTRKGKGPTYVRPFHEMNGDWYKAWMVTRENSADYKKAFARYARILREAMPEVYISFSPNWGDHTGLSIDYWYPGDDVVDVIAPDYYNDYAGDAMNSVEAWNAWSTEKDKNGNPFGLEAWRLFAKEHGKPLAFPEWGLKPSGQGGGDSPEWLKAVNAWMNKNANTATWSLGADIPKAAAGKVLYSCYFNVVHGGDQGFTIYGHGANSRSASIFNGLKWGNIR